MDSGKLNLFIKQISEEYALTQEQALILSHRLMADNLEFEKIWRAYRSKMGLSSTGVDKFRPVLQELIT